MNIAFFYFHIPVSVGRKRSLICLLSGLLKRGGELLRDCVETW